MLTSLAYLGFNDIKAIEQMTLREYDLRLEAYNLKKLNRQQELATLAWWNQQVQATTKGKHPKPIYNRFDKFFDRQTEESRIRSLFGDDYTIVKSERQKKLDDAELFRKRVEEFERLKAAGKIDMNAWKREREKEGIKHG